MEPCVSLQQKWCSSFKISTNFTLRKMVKKVSMYWNVEKWWVVVNASETMLHLSPHTHTHNLVAGHTAIVRMWAKMLSIAPWHCWMKQKLHCSYSLLFQSMAQQIQFFFFAIPLLISCGFTNKTNVLLF